MFIRFFFLLSCGFAALFSALASASVDELIPVQEQIVKLQTRQLDPVAKPITLIEKGPALKMGSKGARVQKLNTRLAELGYLSGNFDDQFDEVTDAAVRAYQAAAGLVVDGVVDHQTRFNLNLSDQDKLEILRSQLQDMERFFSTVEDQRYIIVNLPSYTLRAYEGGKRVFESKVVVGSAARQTPLMKSNMTAIVFHPSWSPPKTILAKDIFRNGEIHAKTVARMGLQLIDARGKKVSMDEVQIAKQSDLIEGGYRFMQPAGERNALGRLKFDLDNPHSIYLHDTNHRELFGRQSRAMSSGCVRVDSYRELAAWVTGKSLTEIDQELLNRRTRRLSLEKIPVYTVYWIADVTQGKAVFSRDIYARIRLSRASGKTAANTATKLSAKP